MKTTEMNEQFDKIVNVFLDDESYICTRYVTLFYSRQQI